MENEHGPDSDRYRTGNPGWEYAAYHGRTYEETRNATLDDILFALMRSADCMWEELRAIRKHLESGR